MKVKIEHIKISDNNPRKHFDDGRIESLAKNIKEYGLITPIAVKKYGDKNYMLIAGERRLRAVKMNGDKEIEVNVIQLPDEAIEKVRLIENIQRQDLHPMEEAFHIERLLWESSVPKMVKQLNKSKQYITDKIKLTCLVEEWKVLFFENVINELFAIQIARLQKNDQLTLLDKLVYESENHKFVRISHTQLKLYIINNIAAKLANTKFDKNDDSIGVGACVDCKFRSGHNKTLFNDIANDDICFKPECFNQKMQSFCKKSEKKYEIQGFNVVRLTDKMFDDGFEHDFNYRLNNHNIDIIIEKAIESKNQNNITLGIYFGGNHMKNIGHVVQILPAETTGGTEKHEGLYAIRLGKAIKAYTNIVIKEMAEMIGERPTELMQPPTLRYLGAMIYAGVEEELRNNIKAHYKWKITAKTPPEVYHANTETYSYARLCELMLFTLTYGGVKSKSNPAYKELLYKMAGSWGIDIDNVKKEIEIEFNVEL